MPDYRKNREEGARDIADTWERLGMPRDKALRWGEQRMDAALSRVTRDDEREGKSRPIELRSK